MAEDKRFKIEFAPVESVRLETRMMNEDLQEIYDALDALRQGRQEAVRITIPARIEEDMTESERDYAREEARDIRRSMAGRIKRLVQNRMPDFAVTVRITRTGVACWKETPEEQTQREERGKALQEGKAKAEREKAAASTGNGRRRS